ncbi:MAG: hypothetical protein JW892_00815 [Anaerolineae bacterium]|nr:hypothetical protein [Anaerolineae bacterium]
MMSGWRRRWGVWLDVAPARILATCLFFATTLVFLVTQVNVIGGDSPPTVFLPVTLLRWGTFRLDPLIGEVPVLFDLSRNPHYLIHVGGHYYSKFSPLTSLLVLPLYGLYFAFGGAQDNYVGILVISRVAATLICATNVVLLFHVLRRLIPQRQAWWLALVYAFGTFTWAVATNALATQATAELFFLLALGCLLDVSTTVDSGKPAPSFTMILTGFYLALAFAARAQVAPVAAILFLGLILLGSWRAGMRGALGGLPVACLWGLYNTRVFGAPWSTGYGLEAHTGWTTPLSEGLIGILFSPAHGLLMYSPTLLLAFGGAWAAWHRGKVFHGGPKLRELLRLISIASLIYLLMMSRWWAWHGGNAYNQRMLQEIHPLLLILVAYGWQVFEGQWTYRISLLLSSVWSVFMNLARITFYDRHLHFVEHYQPELVWALADCEVVMYVRWHGLSVFLRELAVTVGRVGAILGLVTLLSAFKIWLVMNESDACQ